MAADEVTREQPITAPHRLFEFQAAHPVAISLLLDHTYGDEWVAWDPLALWLEIEHEYRVTISELSRTKLQAVRTLRQDSRFWTEWEIFVPIVVSLNNRIPNFWLIQRPTPAQMMAAVDIAAVYGTRPYSDEISRFVAAVFLDEGVTYSPPPLDFANRYLEGHKYTCPKCGLTTDDDHNWKCDSCGNPDIQKHNIRNPEGVKKRFESVVHGGYDVLEETEIDVQVAKLLMAHNYVQMRRQQLEQQLPLVGGERA